MRGRPRLAQAVLSAVACCAVLLCIPGANVAQADGASTPTPAGPVALNVTAASPFAGSTAAGGPAGDPAELDGYQWIDYFRSLGELAPVTRDPELEAAEAVHVRYLADHSLGCETDVHAELLSATGGCGPNPYATPAGKAAAANSDITRMTGPASDRTAVQNLFTSGFHALMLLEPRLRSTGYAAYYTATPTGARPDAFPFTAAVDVYRGRTGDYRGTTLAFPAAGAVSPLLAYRVGTERPEPFASTTATSPCHGWQAKVAVSAPVIVQWPVGSTAMRAHAQLVDLTAGRALPTCALTAADYPAGSLPQQYLLGTNRVTSAALYYGSAPFVAGHRYLLVVGGSVITTFSTAELPSLPDLSVQRSGTQLIVSWPAAAPGTAQVRSYRLSWFASARCAQPLGSTETADQSIRLPLAASGRPLWLRATVTNTLGASRSTSCVAMTPR